MADIDKRAEPKSTFLSIQHGKKCSLFSKNVSAHGLIAFIEIKKCIIPIVHSITNFLYRTYMFLDISYINYIPAYNVNAVQ